MVIGHGPYIKTLLAFLALFLVGCKKDTSSRNPALLLYNGASDVHFYDHDPIEQLSYTVTIEFPAKEVIAWIKDQLAIQGWQPLDESYLNPGIKSSHITGWHSFVDGTTHPKLRIHQWLAEWRNIDGDTLTYGFQYKYPEKGIKDLKKLFIYSSLSPKEIAELQKNNL